MVVSKMTLSCCMRATAILSLLISWVAIQDPLHAKSGHMAPGKNVYAKEKWKRIMDRRGSSVLVPSRAQIYHDNEVVILRIDELSVRFWTMTEGRRGFPGNNPEGDIDLNRSDCDELPPKYVIIKKYVAVFSCEKKQNIKYYFSRYSKYGGVFLFFEYPKQNKKKFDLIVARISSSILQVARVAQW